MDFQTKQRLLALATLLNLFTGSKKHARRPLQAIKPIDHLRYVIAQLTAPAMVRTGLGVLLNHRDLTSDILFHVLTDTGPHYRSHHPMLCDGLLRRFPVQSKGWVRNLLTRVPIETAAYLLRQLGNDVRYQSLLISIFPDSSLSHLAQEFARAIMHHPLPSSMLSELIDSTMDADARQVFAVTAAARENLSHNELRDFFQAVEGDEPREIAFVEALHVSHKSVLCVLLAKTGFERVQKVCFKKLLALPPSLSIAEDWVETTEREQLADALRYFSILLEHSCDPLSTESLLDQLEALSSCLSPARRTVIMRVLAKRRPDLERIAGIALP